MSRKSRASAEKTKSDLGFGTSLGTSDLSVDELRTTIHKAAAGNAESSASLTERLAPEAWPIAYCFSEKPDEVFAMVTNGVVATVATTSEGKGEYDPNLEMIRATRGAAASVKQMKATPNRKRRRTKAADALVNSSSDPVAALAFGALGANQRFLLWTLVVNNLAPSTVARLTDTPTKKVQDGLRRATYMFRRHYVNRVDRKAMAVACSAALDEFPDFLSRRLPKKAETELSAHIESCATCQTMITKLRALEGRLIDAIPPYASALSETTYAELMTRYPPAAISIDDATDAEDEELAPETPIRTPDARTWWLGDSRKSVAVIATTAAAATFLISAAFANPSPTTATIADTGFNTTTSTSTSTTVLGETTLGPETTTTVAALAVTSTSTVLSTTTTAAPVTTTTTTPASTPTTAPRVNTTVPALIVDLPGAPAPTTTAAPPPTTTTTAPVTTTTVLLPK